MRTLRNLAWWMTGGDSGRFTVPCERPGGSNLPDYRSCDEALTRDGSEEGATGAPVDLGNTTQDYLVLLVPGLGWECFEEWLDYEGLGSSHIAQFGYEMRQITVDGLSGTDNNASQIRDYIEALPPADAGRPIILLGYSKGVPDILSRHVPRPATTALW